jgi:two-component system phosphate regulon response regulator OmpR
LESVGRSEDRKEEVIQFDGWILNTARRRLVSPTGDDVVLTSGQFDLLATLAKHPGRVFSRETLIERTRGHSMKAFDRTIDAQIARLRKKIERDPRSPTIVKSVRAVGYVFTARVDR